MDQWFDTVDSNVLYSQFVSFNPPRQIPGFALETFSVPSMCSHTELWLDMDAWHTENPKHNPQHFYLKVCSVKVMLKTGLLGWIDSRDLEGPIKVWFT